MPGQQCFCSTNPPKSTKDKSTCACCVDHMSNKSNQTRNRKGRIDNKKNQTNCARCRAAGKSRPINKPDKQNRPCKHFKPCICSKAVKRSNKSKKIKAFCKCAGSSAKKKGRCSSKSSDRKKKISCCFSIKGRKSARKCKCANAPKVRSKPPKVKVKRRDFNSSVEDCTCSHSGKSRTKKKKEPKRSSKIKKEKIIPKKHFCGIKKSCKCQRC